MKIGKNNDLIKRLTEKGYVLRFETDKYYLNNNDILFSSNEEREKVYRMIEKMCLNREIIPPPFDKNRLDKIKYKFPLLKLEEQLNKRCSEFKNGDLYEYIFKCFNITQKQPLKNTYDEPCLILMWYCSTYGRRTSFPKNKRGNDNLEQQAQALFKAWFVDNAVIGDASVSDYFIPLRGKNLLTSDAKGGEVPVVAGGLTPSAYHNVANTKAPVITISASGANAGYVNLWGIPVWSADSSYIDSSITPHIYFWYNLLKFSQKNIFDSQTGSAQPHIYPKHIGDIRIPDLDLDKVADYNKIVTPIYEQITNTKKINAQLAETRDTLLPKLMSGELKIGKVEM